MAFCFVLFGFVLDLSLNKTKTSQQTNQLTSEDQLLSFLTLFLLLSLLQMSPFTPHTFPTSPQPLLPLPSSHYHTSICVQLSSPHSFSPLHLTPLTSKVCRQEPQEVLLSREGALFTQHTLLEHLPCAGSMSSRDSEMEEESLKVLSTCESHSMTTGLEHQATTEDLGQELPTGI